MTNIVTKKLIGTTDTFDRTFPKPFNVTISGDFGGGTVTQTMKGSTVAIRAAATTDDAYRSLAQEATFTLTGGTAADITITMEPTDA